jgi:predicted phosphodiesterase
VRFAALSPGKRWDLVRRYKEGGSEAIADDLHNLDDNPDTVTRRLREKAAVIDEALEAGVVGRPPPVLPTTTDWELVCAFIGRAYHAPLPDPPKAQYSDHRKIVVFADVHGRFNLGALRYMLEHERPDMTICAGDLTDSYAYSRWAKDRVVPVDEELQHIIAVYEKIICPTVRRNIILWGNHDARRMAYFQKRLDAWALGEISEDPIKVFAKHMPNLEVSEQTFGYTTPTGTSYEGGFTTEYVRTEGDLLVAHPGISRKHAGTTARAFQTDYLNKHVMSMGIPFPAVIAVGHKHTWSHTPGDNNADLVELGYFGEIDALEYAFDGGNFPTYTLQPGYLVVEQTRNDEGEWRADRRSVRYQRY